MAVGCGYIGGWAVSIEASAETFDVLRSVGSVVIAFSSVAAVAVLALTANLTVDTQRRSYALWQLANMKPRLVSAVVLVQLVVVAVLGAMCGTLLTTITFSPLFPWVFGARVEYAQAVPRVGAASMPFVWLAVAGTFLCGGLKGARSAGRTSPLAVLRESKPRRAGMTWMRVLLFAGLAIGAWQVAAIMIGSVPGVVMNWSLYLPILDDGGNRRHRPACVRGDFEGVDVRRSAVALECVVRGAAHRSFRPERQHLGRDAHHGRLRLGGGHLLRHEHMGGLFRAARHDLHRPRLDCCHPHDGGPVSCAPSGRRSAWS